MEILFYEDSHGKSPVYNFIKDLDAQSPKKSSKNAKIQLEQITYQLDVLSKSVTWRELSYVKHIKGKLWELRLGKNRILFFMSKNKKFVLLHNFRKKTQKTPKREIVDWTGRNE